MSDHKSSEDGVLSKKYVDTKVRHLRKAFRGACASYRESNEDSGKRIHTHVLRNLKTQKPLPERDVDYTLYNAEIEFCYMIDEIQRGPRVFAAQEIKKCYDFINSISPK
jgi:hypothetical protein